MKKKMIAVICLVIAMTTLLTACGTLKCELCDKEIDRSLKNSFALVEKGKRTKKYDLCKDCMESVVELEYDEAEEILEDK